VLRVRVGFSVVDAPQRVPTTEFLYSFGAKGEMKRESLIVEDPYRFLRLNVFQRSSFRLHGIVTDLKKPPAGGFWLLYAVVALNLTEIDQGGEGWLERLASMVLDV
jgi:hypothetical protein